MPKDCFEEELDTDVSIRQTDVSVAQYESNAVMNRKFEKDDCRKGCERQMLTGFVVSETKELHLLKPRMDRIQKGVAVS